MYFNIFDHKQHGLQENLILFIKYFQSIFFGFPRVGGGCPARLNFTQPVSGIVGVGTPEANLWNQSFSHSSPAPTGRRGDRFWVSRCPPVPLLVVCPPHTLHPRI